VILPEGHSFDEEKLEKLKVHGSVSFTGFHQFANNKYCVGFDCSHAWDWVPYHERRSYDARLSPVYIEELKDVEYRDIEYVKKECTKLAKQIYNLKQKEQKNDNRI
jgi:hypothetical protein